MGYGNNGIWNKFSTKKYTTYNKSQKFAQNVQKPINDLDFS